MPSRGSHGGASSTSRGNQSRSSRGYRQRAWYRSRANQARANHPSTSRDTTAYSSRSHDRESDSPSRTRHPTTPSATPAADVGGHSTQQDDNEHLDDLNEVIMAVDMRDRDTIGCSYYRAQDEKLYFMEDAKMGNVDIVNQLKLVIDPTVILVSSRADESLLNCLDPDSRARGTSAGEGSE